MRPSHLLAATLALSQVSLAWLDPFGEDSAVIGFDGLLNRRQDENAGDASSDAPAKTTSPPDADSTPTDDENQDENQDPSDASESGPKKTDKATGTENTKEASKTTGKPKQTKFGDLVPAGGIQMMTPGIYDAQQYYKVGDWVTFAWNYTSVKVMPTAVDILASCATNSATYTLAVNQTAHETGKLLWDSGAYQATGNPQLLTSICTLIIYDSNSSVSASPVPGYLAPFKQFTFGMYTPQPYTPWSDYRCPTCNGAGSLTPTELHSLAMVGITGTITILSFTWFANGFGIF